MKLLIDANSGGIYIKDGSGRIPLHHACANANSKGVLNTLVRLLVKWLLLEKKLSYINTRDNDQGTPLYILTKRTDPSSNDNSIDKWSDADEFIVQSEVVKYLVENKADIFAMVKEGEQVRETTHFD